MSVGEAEPHTPTCAHHNDREAVALGGRCGNYLCEECLKVPQPYCCVECRHHLLQSSGSGVNGGLFVGTCIIGYLIVFGLRSPVLILGFCIGVIFLFFTWLQRQQVPLGPAQFASVQDEEDDGEEEQEAGAGEAGSDLPEANSAMLDQTLQAEVSRREPERLELTEPESEHSVLAIQAEREKSKNAEEPSGSD